MYIHVYMYMCLHVLPGSQSSHCLNLELQVLKPHHNHYQQVWWDRAAYCSLEKNASQINSVQFVQGHKNRLHPDFLHISKAMSFPTRC